MSGSLFKEKVDCGCQIALQQQSWVYHKLECKPIGNKSALQHVDLLQCREVYVITCRHEDSGDYFSEGWGW